MYKIIKCEQGTDLWLKTRAPLITASEFAKVTTPAQCKRSTSLNTLINKKVAVKLTGMVEETFKSEAMQYGNDTEDEALEFLNFTYGHNFEKVGFLKSLEIPCGGSPDAIDFENKIGAEIKCPINSTQVEYLLNGKIPNIYSSQVQGLMMITGFNSWIFLSYSEHLKPFYIKVDRNEKYIEALKNDLIYAGSEIKSRYEQLKD